jgi:uncharacterized DUF497 family protein
VEFDWDNGKYAANINQRQIPFELVSILFSGKTLEKPDDRKAYGEKRIQAHGKIDDRLFVCVYTDRIVAGRLVRWIISLRKANKREIRKYDEWIEAQNI